MLNINDFVTEMRARAKDDPIWARVALSFQSLQDGVNQVGSATGTSPNDHIGKSDPPSNISVAAGSDHVHVTLNDTQQRSRALHYFVEWSANDPSFQQPHVEHLGPSRGRVLALPAKDGNNATINYYFRGYSHYLGASKASDHIVYGGQMNPTPVTLTGASTLNLLPSTGSGTQPTNGQKAGHGWGLSQFSRLQTNDPKAP